MTNANDVCAGCGNHWKDCKCQNPETKFVPTDMDGVETRAREANRAMRLLRERRLTGRFARLRDLIKQQYVAANHRPCPWTGAEMNQLKGAIARLSQWKLEELENCVLNRFGSDKNHTEPPRSWLSNLEAYANGPLDRFNNLLVEVPEPEPEPEPERPGYFFYVETEVMDRFGRALGLEGIGMFGMYGLLKRWALDGRQATVRDLAATLDLPEDVVRKHIERLRSLGLVKAR